MAAKLKLILLENVKGYGNKGTIIEVSAPYAQNVLIPKGQAKIADQKIINEFNQKIESTKKHHDEEIQKIKDMVSDLKQKGLKLLRQATPMQHIYDKVDQKDIVKEILVVYKVKLPESAIKLSHKIEELGEFPVKFEYEGIKESFEVIVERKN